MYVLLKVWDTDDQFYHLLDHALVKITPDLATELLGKIALVRQLKANIDYPVHWEVFTERKAALAWLLTIVC